MKHPLKSNIVSIRREIWVWDIMFSYSFSIATSSILYHIIVTWPNPKYKCQFIALAVYRRTTTSRTSTTTISRTSSVAEFLAWTRMQMSSLFVECSWRKKYQGHPRLVGCPLGGRTWRWDSGFGTLTVMVFQVKNMNTQTRIQFFHVFPVSIKPNTAVLTILSKVDCMIQCNIKSWP